MAKTGWTGLLAACACAALAETKTIDLLPDELWWGGTVGGGWQMPLDATSDYAKDLRVDSDGNQAAPLLLSTKGRWVWCEDAFAYTFRGGRLTVETGPAPRRTGAAPHPMDVNAAPAADGTKARAGQIPNVEKTCYAKKAFAPIQSGTAKGGTLRSAFEHCSRTFFPPQGMPRLEWFQQPILNTWAELNYNQNEEDILRYAKSFLANGMKPGVFQIDCFWHTDNFGSWTFHGARFKDPKGFVEKLKALGFHVILWYAPFVTLDSMPYRALRAQGGILKDARLRPYGKGYQGLPIQWWDGYSAVWDPTSPCGRAWNSRTMRRIMDDYGVEGFFFDGGGPHEFPPGDYIACDHAAQPTDLTRAFQMSALDVPFGQCREAWKMGGLPVMQTLRDKAPKWSEMRRCVTDMIAAGLLGYPFVVADLVGGGTCGCDGGAVRGLDWQDELFIRHLQIECLSPMVMFSGSPWRVLSPEGQRIVQDLLLLRARFAPRIVALATETARTGLPMLRSMEFQYPGRGYARVLDQFMMGDGLLVAPVVEGGKKTRTVVIPEGTWRADDNTIVVGPKTVEVETPLARLPYFELLTLAEAELLTAHGTRKVGDGGKAAPAVDAAAIARVEDAAPDALVAPRLRDVKMLGYAGRKCDAFLRGRVLSDFAKEEIFGEAFDAIQKKEDDASGVVGFWQGEFWGKLMMSAARVADYTQDPGLIGFVRDACHRLMATQEADGYIGSYANKEFVTGPDRNDKAQMDKVHKALKLNWDCDYCWNLWGRKYTMWGMILAYELTRDRAILTSVERQMDQWIDMMHRLGTPLWKTGEPTYVGLPSMSVLKPLMRLYRITGKKKYLAYAREMLRAGGRRGAEPRGERRAQGADPHVVSEPVRLGEGIRDDELHAGPARILPRDRRAEVPRRRRRAAAEHRRDGAQPGGVGRLQRPLLGRGRAAQRRLGAVRRRPLDARQPRPLPHHGRCEVRGRDRADLLQRDARLGDARRHVGGALRPLPRPQLARSHGAVQAQAPALLHQQHAARLHGRRPDVRHGRPRGEPQGEPLLRRGGEDRRREGGDRGRLPRLEPRHGDGRGAGRGAPRRLPHAGLVPEDGHRRGRAGGRRDAHVHAHVRHEPARRRLEDAAGRALRL